MQSCITLWQIFTHQLCEVTRILWLTISLARSQCSQLSWIVKVSNICRLPNVFTIGIFRQRMPLKSKRQDFCCWAQSFPFLGTFIWLFVFFFSPEFEMMAVDGGCEFQVCVSKIDVTWLKSQLKCSVTFHSFAYFHSLICFWASTLQCSFGWETFVWMKTKYQNIITTHKIGYFKRKKSENHQILSTWKQKLCHEMKKKKIEEK